MPTINPYVQSGSVPFDVAISTEAGSIPFFAAQSKEIPYVRQTADYRKQQIDTSREPGEQALQTWWLRSQSSFHLGAGARFMEPSRDPNLAYRFEDSHGVDVWTKGQVSLLRKATLARSTGTSCGAVGYANGSENGVLFAYGTSLEKVTDSGVTGISWGAGTAIYSFDSNGRSFFVAATDGVYTGLLSGTTGSKIYSFPTSVNRSKIAWAKDRLIVCANSSVFVSVPEPGNLTPAPTLPVDISAVTDASKEVYQHPVSSWVWSDVADGPSAVYLSGYAGESSAIFALEQESQGAGLAPTWGTPRVVAELPRGEQALSVTVYTGTYLIVGTTRGVRIGLIRTDGGLVLGPLTWESDNPVFSTTASGQYVYCGGANSDGKHGIVRIDLANPVDPEALLFSWAKDVYGDTATFSGAWMSSVVNIGASDRRAFTVDGHGLVFEAASEKVASGWLKTGRIRFDTTEDKIFQFVRVNNLVTDGSIKVSWVDYADATADLYTWSTITPVVGPDGTLAPIRSLETEGSDAKPQPYLQYKFTLYRGSNTSSSAIMLGYTAKAQPSGVKQREIRIPLQCYLKETHAISRRVVERPTWPRIAALESAEKRGSVVRYQDLRTGEDVLALIESVQFVAEEAPTSRDGQANPGGVLVVTLRTVT